MTDETVVAFRPGRRRLEFRLFADIDPAIRKRWLVSNFLGEAELSCVYGPPSSFKSGFAGDVAAHIGSGQPFCGRRVAQGAVLYIACERGALVLRRFRAWRLHHGIHDMPLGIVCNSIDLRGSVPASTP